MTLNKATRLLPIAGIVAFSLCSVNSVAHLFLDAARYPTATLWLSAALVELVTAWLVFQAVQTARQVTKSRISKQDRRFYGGALITFLVLSVPSLGLSVAANTREFGSLLLGVQFPLLSVGCAVGAAVPDAVARFEQARASERQEAAKERKERAREKQVDANQAQEVSKLLPMRGKIRQTLRQYAIDPMQTQSSVAQKIGLSRQAVGEHLTRLEGLGLIRRNGRGIEVLVELDF